MKYLKRYLCSIVLLIVCLLLSAVSVSFGATNDGQVQVPVVIDVSHAIAGVEFAFEYSSGLEFVSYEQSAAVSSATTTSVVVKNGQTHLGFYSADNRYVPVNGKLDCGFFVFNRLGNTDGAQVVKLVEIKLVQVVDKDNTRSELLAPVEIKITSEDNAENSSVNDKDDNNGGTSSTGTKTPSTDNGGNASPPDSVKNSPTNDASDILSTDTKNSPVDAQKDSWLSTNFWVVFVFLIIVVCGVGVFVFLKKRVNPK
ncbi:MAG: hypothetical protein FWH37_07420 [Candidatus Bathyarchaeota archaeon]|nr:hypothetical protein [Candidatus Termiticorpusculum sp.]